MSKTWNPQEVSSIHNINLVCPDEGEVRPDVDLELRGHEIAAIGTVSALRETGGARLDGIGLFAVPGLIDTHVHATSPLVVDIPSPLDLRWVFAQQRRNLVSYVQQGFTTIRDMAAPVRLVRRLSRQAARHEIQSPRVFYAGPMITIPKGYPHYLRPLPPLLRMLTGPLRVELESKRQARRVVEELAAAGVHCIKVAYQSAQYDDARSSLPTISPELIRVIVDEAHRLGLNVAMHQLFLKDFRDLQGVAFDSSEHVPIDGPLTEQDIQHFVQRGIPIASTMSAFGMLDHIDDMARIVSQEPERFESKPQSVQRQVVAALQRGEIPSPHFGEEVVHTGARWVRHNVRALAEAGVRVGFASDSGPTSLPGCPQWEFEQMKRAGFSNLEALRSATTDAARILGQDKLGRLQVGKTADILIVQSNPLDDLRALQEIVAVIRDGRLMVSSEAGRQRLKHSSASRTKAA